MNVLHICDFASPTSGNFMEELGTIDSALKNETGGKIIYALPVRNIKYKNKWVDDLKKEHPVYIYETDPLKKIKIFRKIISDESIDIVHVHFTDMKADIGINIAAFGKKVKIIKHYRSGFGIWSKTKINIGKLVYKNWLFICIAPAMFDECKANYPASKCKLILNPISFRRLDNYDELSRDDIAAENCDTVCLMVGYNYKLKGIDIAADAVSKLREKQNIGLSIVPTANLEGIKSDLSNQFGGSLPNWIKFLPPRNDIASYYRAADICLAPSRSEGACSAIIEECYCGKAVVASDCAGQRTYVGDNLDVIWFENQNSDDLKEKIEEALSVKDEKRFTEGNRIRALEHYSLDTYKEQIIDVYKSL